MNDVGSELRWILLIFSVVLIAGLYIAGRWGRRQSVTADPARDNGYSDARYDETSASNNPVPQLDEVVSHRERHVEPHVTIIADEDYPDDDGFPSVHIDGRVTDQQLTAMQADARAMYSEHEAASESSHETYNASRRDSGESSSAYSHAYREASSSPALVDDEATPDEAIDYDSHASREATPVSAPVATPARPAYTQAAQRGTNKSPAAAIKKPSGRKIVALRLVAGTQRFDGEQLKCAFEAAKLKHGKFDIYHRYDEQELTVFSIASMVEPGTFDPQAMSSMQFQGVMLFAQLPGPMDGELMFEQMLDCAEQLAGTLNGTVQDERGIALTPQRAARIRDDIADFQHLVGGDGAAQRDAAGEGVSAP
jgi:cell division protein ZipA